MVIAVQLYDYLKNHWVVMRRKTSELKTPRGKWIITFKSSLEKKLDKNIKINPKKWKNKGNKDEKK